MTEFELHYLISEAIGHTNLTYQGWFAASSAVLLVSYYSGSKIKKSLRNIVAIAYVFYSLICYLGLIKFYYTIDQYSQELASIDGIPFPSLPYLDIFNGYLLFYLFVGGTVLIAGYFLRSSRSTEPPESS